MTETTGTDVCFVHLLDEHGTRLQLRGATPPFDDLVGKIELSLGEGVSGWVALHGEPAVLVDDKADDPRYRYIPALRGEDFASMVSVPVVTPLGHLVGVLNVHTKLRREFTSADVELLRSVAGLVAGAIENARLHRRLAEREEALEQFAEQMVEWQEHESRRLAGEIHDGISQRIVSLFFHLSAAADAIPGEPDVAAEQVARAQELAAAALDETRSAIAGCARRFSTTSGWPPAWRAWVAPSRSLTSRSTPPAAGSPSMSRPRCTARRRRPCKTWSSTLSAMTVQVRTCPVHDGSVPARSTRRRPGLRPPRRGRTAESASPTGFGLSGMRERAELLGGRLDLSSSPGRGTTVRLVLPLSPATQAE